MTHSTRLISDDDRGSLLALEAVPNADCASCADSGYEAVERTRRRLRAIVMDVRMPGLDGYAASLSDRTPVVPTPFFSSPALGISAWLG